MRFALFVCACLLFTSEGADVEVEGFPGQDAVCGAIKDDSVKYSVVSSVCSVQGDITGIKPPSWSPPWLKNATLSACDKALGVAWDEAIGCVCDGVSAKLGPGMCPYFYRGCAPPEDKCNNNPPDLEKSVKYLTVKAIRDTACSDKMHGTTVGALCITGWDPTWTVVWNAYDYVIGCVCQTEAEAVASENGTAPQTDRVVV